MIGSAIDSSETSSSRDGPSSADEDAAILAEIGHANNCRFDLLVDRYKVRLVTYIRHRVQDRHHAEDLAQETFLKMFRAARAGGYRGQATVCTWLFTIADNCIADYLRSVRRHPLALEIDVSRNQEARQERILDGRPSTAPGPAEAAERRESQNRVEATLDQLPDDQRRVVALKVLGGLTLAEVADVVGCPLGTVKSRLLYGLRKIEVSLRRSGRFKDGQ